MSLATVGIVVRGTPCCPRRDRPSDAPHFGRVCWEGIGGIDVRFVQSDSDTREKTVSKKLEYGAGGGETLAAMSGDEYANSGGRCARQRAFPQEESQTVCDRNRFTREVEIQL